MKRIVLISFLICVFCVLGLLFFRLQVTALLLNQGLIHAGFTNVQTKITALSLTEIKLSHLNLSRQETGLNLDVKNITLGWSKTSLISNQLKTVDIDSININFPRRDKKPTKKDWQLAELVGKLQEIIRQLPFQLLTIRHIVINSEAITLPAGKPISFSIRVDKNKKENKLISELYLHKPAIHVLIEYDGLQEWKVKITESAGSAEFAAASPLLISTINLQNGELQLEAQVELARLSLFNPILTQPLPVLAGTLSLKTVQPFDPETSRFLQVDIKNLQLADLHAKSLKLTIQGKRITPSLFSITENSYIKAMGISSEQININFLKLNINGEITKYNGLWQYRFTEKSKLTTRELSTPPLKISSLTVFPALTIGVFPVDEQISIKLSSDFKVLATGIKADELSLEEMTISPEKESIFSLSLPEQTWNLTPSLWQISVDDLKNKRAGLSITSAPFVLMTQTVDGSKSGYQLKGRLLNNDSHIKTTENGFNLHDLDINFKITNIPKNSDSSKDIRITSHFSFIPATVSGKINGKLFHNLQTGTGGLTLKTTEPLSFSKTAPLSSLIDKWPLDKVELSEGDLNSEAEIKWQLDKPIHAFVKASLEHGRGVIGETGFSGLSLRHALSILPSIRSQKPGIIHIDQLNSLVKINNMQKTIKLSPSRHGKLPVIHINHILMETLGGTISGKNITFDPQQPNFETEIIIHYIDLAELAQIQQIQGLDIKGKIHGRLPVRFDEAGLHINDGIFNNSNTKGIIRYTPTGGEGMRESPLTGYALLALEEFHYHLLNAQVEYSPNGTLLVRLRLEGISPKLKTDRPVHLNINIEQNILSLLESLRYSQQITKKIEQKLEKHKYGSDSHRYNHE